MAGTKGAVGASPYDGRLPGDEGSATCLRCRAGNSSETPTGDGSIRPGINAGYTAGGAGTLRVSPRRRRVRQTAQSAHQPVCALLNAPARRRGLGIGRSTADARPLAGEANFPGPSRAAEGSIGLGAAPARAQPAARQPAHASTSSRRGSSAPGGCSVPEEGRAPQVIPGVGRPRTGPEKVGSRVSGNSAHCAPPRCTPPASSLSSSGPGRNPVRSGESLTAREEARPDGRRSCRTRPGCRAGRTFRRATRHLQSRRQNQSPGAPERH